MLPKDEHPQNLGGGEALAKSSTQYNHVYSSIQCGLSYIHCSLTQALPIPSWFSLVLSPHCRLYSKAAAPIIAATTPVRPSAASGTAAPVNCVTLELVRLATAPVPVAPPAALVARDAADEAAPLAREAAEEAAPLAREAAEDATELAWLDALAACEEAAEAALERADETAADALERTLEATEAAEDAAREAEAARDEADARMLEAAYWALEIWEAAALAAAEARALETAETLRDVRILTVRRCGWVDLRVLRSGEAGHDGNGDNGETHPD